MGYLNFWRHIKAQWARRMISNVLGALYRRESSYVCNALDWSMYVGFSEAEHFWFLTTHYEIRRNLVDSIFFAMQGNVTLEMFVNDRIPGIHTSYEMMRHVRLIWCLDTLAHIRTTNRIEMAPLMVSINTAMKTYREA